MEEPMSKTTRLLAAVLSAVTLFAAASASAQAPPPPPPYGSPITLDQAKKAMAAAEAEAKKNSWPVVIAILDTGGLLVMLQRLDNTQWGSIEVAKDKARSAVAFRRPTKVFSDAIAQGGANVRLLNLNGASLIEGGVPIIVDGKIIGAVGVSGVTAQQDAQVAQAGADALK
jgi:glc operon protein GlcG